MEGENFGPLGLPILALNLGLSWCLGLAHIGDRFGFELEPRPAVADERPLCYLC